MIRLFLVTLAVCIVLFVLWKRSSEKNDLKKSKIYKNIILLIILSLVLILIASQGKFILPKIFQILKMIIPFVTKFLA